MPLVPVPPRAILYARVSTYDKQTPEVQLEQLRAVAAQRGWIVAGEITERRSGAKDKRPGLDDALSMIGRAQASILAATALDRVGRSLRHILNVQATLQQFGCTLVLLRENVDTSTPTGQFAFSIMGAAAQLELALIRERVCAGLAHARTQGRIGGRRRTLDYSAIGAVRAHRDRGDSWREIVRVHGGTIGGWSRALSRSPSLLA